MKKLLLVASSIFLAGTAFARPDCKSIAKQSALAVGAVVNQNPTDYIAVTEISNSAVQQVFSVAFDTEERGASVTYTVTVERNPSPIVANQWCMRVKKVELTGEE